MLNLKVKDILVIPTDTIYGICGSALFPAVVERIYKLRKRTPSKPMIILISSIDEINKFDIKLTDKQKQVLGKIWPNPVSIILPCLSEKFAYLHRGTKTLAFRMPKKDSLLKLLQKTGSLVAPSANFEGETPARNIEEAKKYFGDKVDYIDGGILESKPSTVIELTGDNLKIIREGLLSALEIKKLLE